MAAQTWTQVPDDDRFKAVFDNALEAILLADDDRRYVEVNDAACELLGRTREELLALRVDDVFPEAAASALWEQFLVEGTRRGEQEIRRPDGEVRHVEFVSRANVLPGIHLSVKRDVTTRRRLEEQLRESQKLEIVGRLAGGLAHDFNNLLTAILGYSELLERRLDAGDAGRRDIAAIRDSAEKARDLTSQLLAFSRQQILQPETLDPNAVVRELEQMLPRLLGKDVAVETELGHAVGSVRVDPGRLRQVIANIAVNAREAMPDGGSLTIQTGEFELTPELAPRYELEPGSYVSFVISDTGHGMDEQTRRLVFEPFFTTKAASGNSGLGLSTVFGIVKQSGGAIWVESEPGQGARFTICLPRVQEAKPAEEPAPAAEPEADRPRTVLLLEDEQVVRTLVREVLEHGGFKVLEAETAAQALDLAGRHSAIDVLLTDVVMPTMSGPQVAAELALASPELKVIFMSGYTDEAVLRHGAFDGKTAFIQKPFTAAELTEKVRSMLDDA